MGHAGNVAEEQLPWTVHSWTPRGTRGACMHNAVTPCTWSRPISRPRVCRHVTWRGMPQPWLPRVETEPSMAEQGIEGATPGRSFSLEEAKGFQGLRWEPKHHPAILTSQMQSQHPLQRSHGHYPTQCGI